MRARVVIAFVFVQVLCAAARGDITSASLQIQGAGLRVETVSVTTGTEIPTTIQTSFGGRTNDDAAAAPGLLAVCDLTGPGIDVPIQLTTTPGHRFHIPGLQRIGDYYLQNVRLMNGNAVLQQATPSTAKITVADLLQTSLKVKQLTAEEIRARGIVVDARNYEVYEYTFTFLVNGQEVEVPFPVIIDPRTHTITPVVEEKDYGLPSPTKNVQPPRWSPPDVIPFEFPDAPATDVPVPGTTPRDRGVRPNRPRIPAALVIPNSLAVLHQFFAVMLTVTNGAPDGSTARLEDVAATLKIAVPNALRAVKSTPSVAFGQAVPVVDPNTGVTVLVAQAKGEAEWVLEGLKPGTHTVEVDIRATLREQGQEDVFLRATPSASVIIHDPRFNITFSHPDTVRKGVEYATYAFITNMSPQTQTIRATDGLPLCTADQTPNVCRVSGGPPPSDMTIGAGEMRVVEYRLRAGETGQVFATAGSIDGDAITAAVQLHMGVSATGIPLSPATLVLPHYAQYVAPNLVSSYLELLGLGYSLATAPLNQITAQLPRVIKTDVFYRATDIARAGQRLFIGEASPAVKRDALSNLFLDLLGNGLELREWDELRRSESGGRRAGGAVVAELRDALMADQSSMAGAIGQFASETAHRGDYVLALAHGPAGTERPLAIEIRGVSGRAASIANEADSGWIRDLAFADVSRFDAFGRAGELAIAGRWTEDLELVITPAVSGDFELELLFPGGTGGTSMQAHVAMQGSAGVPLRIPLTPGATTVNVLAPNGGFAATVSATPVALEPLAILGARQDLHLDREGHKVSVLFSRPIKPGEDLLPRFAGAIDFHRDGIDFSDARPIFAAALQQDERVVNLSFDHVLSTNASYTIAVSPLIDPITSASVPFPQPVVPKIDNDRPAGIVYGKFLTGTNQAIPNAEIKFFTGHFIGCIGAVQVEEGLACNPFAEAPQYARTRADGSFLFEYVPRDVVADPNLTGAYKAVGVTAEGKATAVEGAVRLPGRVHIVNLQLLGRGSAEGKVRYDNGEIAAGVRVHVSSTLFNIGRDATTDANGAFRVDDLAVGPITFSAADDDGNVAFASAEISTPGQVAVKELVIYRKPFPGTGTVYGRVTRSDDGAPVFGARVGVSSQGYGFAETTSDSDGRFEFTKVPAGFVTLLAAEWSISRENAAADFDLRPDETKEMNLTLSVTPSDMKFVRVTGRVLRENPLYPGDATRYERVPGAVVNLAILTTTADDNGEFAFDGVPIVAAGKTIRAYDPSTKRFTTTTVPTLTEAGPNDVTVFIPANSYGGGTIRVRVVSAAGLAVDGFRVIEPGFPPTLLTRVGAGIYEYRDAPVGSDIPIYAVDGPAAYGEQVAAGLIKLDFAGQTATLILRLPGQGTVRAKLRSDLDLIGDVSLTYPVWSEAEQQMEAFTVVRSTNENGSAGFATFSAVPALQRYTISSVHPLYGYAEQSGLLAFDGDVGLHTLQLSKLATVHGTVYAIDGVTPVGGAAVRLHDGRADAGIVYTQPDGTFLFRDVPANTSFFVTAEVTQSGVYRVGVAYGTTPSIGGPAPETSVILRRRGSVEGRVVYANYKVYDPDNPNNRVADDTPGDYSDNAPVPLARLWLRELDYPGRTFGTNADPLVADVGGRFALSNVFTGSLRARAWSAENQELQGDWTGELRDEGEVLTGVFIAIGSGGSGSLQVKVVDPNQQYLPIANAEVRVYGAGRLFDLTTTDDAGLARFDELPAGNYSADAYSKSLGKSGAGTGFTIVRDQLTDLRILLEFVGKVDGRLSDPMFTPSRALTGVPVKLTASSFYALATSDGAGLFFFEGIREGTFELEAKDTASNRWARAQGRVSPENRRPFVELELEKTESLHVAVYLPDDTGANSGTLAGPFDVDVVQRCVGGTCDYHRTLQGNALTFPGLFLNARYGGAERYDVTARELGGAGRTLTAFGVFPNATLDLVYPAFGGVDVTVLQAGAPAQGARVEMAQGGERRSVYTDANGKASASGLSLAPVTVQAVSVDGRFSGSTTVTITRQSVPASALIELGAYAGVSGTVEAEANGPSIGTRVVATFSGRTLEVLTGSDGAYLFQGIPTSAAGTTVELTYVGPDGVTIGARQTTVLNNDWASRVRALGSIKLDATPPQLLTITPADGAQNVSPDAPIRFVFSERIQAADLNSNNLQLIAADGSGQVTCTISSALEPDKTFSVTLRPDLQAGERFPLKSNTLYRLVVASSLRDLTGHTLAAPRGATFTTSDYAEPRVLKLVPGNQLPLPAQVTLQFHFNEPVDPQSFVFHFYKLSAAGAAGAIVAEKSGRAYVDPSSGLYLAFAPDQEIEPESYYRAVFSGVRDLQGNSLGQQTFHYFSFDTAKPYLRLVSPVPDGTALVSGVQYTLNVDARSGSLDGPAVTDLARVEYVRVEGAAETLLAVATSAPFAYRFSAPEAPEAGIAYSIKAAATDLSGNVGPASTITWTVKPNAAPRNVAVTLSATSAYPGANVTANVTFEDEGVFAPVQVVARGTNADGTEWVESKTFEATRNTVGEAWPPAALSFRLPLTLKAGSTVTFTASVTDVRGLSASANASLSVLADAIKPVIVSTSPAPETTYNLNARYVVSAAVSDAETGVAEVQFVVDGATYRVSSSTAGTFTSPQITAGARNIDTRIPIVVRAIDYHGNAATRAFDVIYIGVNDPTAPKAAWLCPIDRAVIPAAQSGYTLTLKARAQDDVSVTSVQFRVPGLPDVTATRIGATDDYQAQVTFDTPAAGSDFSITAIVSDADASHTIEVPIAIDVVAFDRLLDATEAVDADNVASYEGKSILVRGAGKLVINVPLTLRDLALVDGGRAETLGTTLTRERKLDLTVTDRLYVDCSSTIDVAAKGYLGGWGVNPDGSGTRSDSATGRTLGNTITGGANDAGASYGGLGGATGITNAPYGSIADPFDLGSGGAGHTTNTSYYGGTGGGAVSLRTSNADDALARVVVAGSVRADGGSGRNGGSGGSIRVNARQLVVGPLAQLSANGGTGHFACGSGNDQCLGGSGGRIALTAEERLDLTTPFGRVTAFGGATGVNGTALAGAAGTIYVRRPGQTGGELYVAQSDDAATVSFTRATPLANVTFERMVLGPWALVRLDGPTSIDTIETDPTAVLVPVGAVPSLSGTTSPASGATVIRNTPVEASLDLAAIDGVMSAELDFSAAPPLRVSRFTSYPATIDGHRVTWTVPPDAPIGPATLKVKVTDRADRSAETTLATFTIIDNAAPTIDSFTTTPVSLYPGHSVTANVSASDDVSVTRISAAAQIGATTPTTQTRTPNTPAANAAFTFAVPIDTPGGTPMTIEAAVEDGFPGRAPTKQSLNVTILTDTLAPQATIDAPLDAQLFEEAAGTFAITVTATDAEVAVKTVAARVAGGANVALIASGNTWTGTLNIPAVDGEEIVSIPVTVTAADYAGNQTTATITIRVRPTIDPNAPTMSWKCGAGAKVAGGTTLRLRAEAVAANAQNPVQKVEFVIAGQPTIAATNAGGNLWQATWNVPAGAATYTIDALGTSSGGAQRSARTTIVVVVADQIFSANATINDATYDNKVIAVTAGTLTITGPHTFTDLLILGGAVTHPAGDTTFALTTGTTYISCDGAIDATGRGYAAGTSYPGATTVPSSRGGSHLGVGGSADVRASTFGSVYEPREAGGGGGNGPGGGAVALNTGNLIVDGAIRANGETIVDGSGAGGSVRIRAARIGGGGTIEANGGGSLSTAAPGGGGGGAVAVEYTDPSSVLPQLRATSASAPRVGGAGTVYVKGPASVFGTLTIDNGGRLGTQATELPSLGNGIAQPGSGGTTLVTGRTIPAYFARHWIEIEGKGTWRVTAVSGQTLTLEAGANVAAGDAWQGVYRFDDVAFNGANIITSRDPIRLPAGVALKLNGPSAANQLLTLTEPFVTESLTVRGNVALPSVTATDTLTVAEGGLLTPYTGSTMAINAATVIVAATGAIDVTGLGYAAGTSYPGASTVPSGRAGSHIGVGGSPDVTASTFGSIDRPQESGGGGGNGPGGGVVSIVASRVTIDGAIRANGTALFNAASGAGGSVWVRTDRIDGIGSIQANGGGVQSPFAPGGGGGGAVAVEYTDPSSVLPDLQANAVAAPRVGGAGTVYVRRPTSTYGDLTIDNRGHIPTKPTDLPALGNGIAQTGSSGTTLVTDLSTNIPPYFIGHWIEIDGKGLWRITAISGKTITLESGANVQSGDLWRGVYRVDRLTLRSTMVQSRDSLRYGVLAKDASSTLTTNAAAPQFPLALRSQITLSGGSIVGPAGAVVDSDTPVKLTATNTRTAQTFTANAAADGSFSIPIAAAAGDTFTLRATDTHVYPFDSITIPVNGVSGGTSTVVSLTIEPATVAGGSTTFGSVRLGSPALSGGAIVSLSSSSAAAIVPASVTIPQGSTSAQFSIDTSSVAASTNAVVTATVTNSVTASLTIVPASASLANLTLSPSSTEGGTSVNATATLGAAAPPGGALIVLSSDSPLVTVPSSVIVPAGASETTFTVATSRVASTASANVTATYGATKGAAVTLTACASMPTAAATSVTLGTTWFDDAPPANATATGDAAFDTTQAASGSQSLHFAAATTTRSWSFAGAAPLAVASSDNLVLYALVNPCNPPRQIAVAWSNGSTEWRASWGESRIAPLATNDMGALPTGAVWTRLAVPAKAIGLSSASLSKLTISVDGGEAWFDAFGSTSCALAKQPPPSFLPNETVWFDDTLPGGAVIGRAFNPDTSQVASGNTSDLVVNAPAIHEHYFTGAATGLSLGADDLIVVYALIDPCNPPREIMLQFHDGTAWSRTAHWGENLIDTGYRHYTDQPPAGVQINTVTQRHMGPLPEAGRWVRLEVPVSSMQMSGTTITGIAFTLYDGSAWFDRVGKTSRVNLALGKSTTQSPAGQPEAWWQVDLGAVQSIDEIDVWSGGVSGPQKFWVLVSEEPFASSSLAAARAQAGVSAYYQEHNAQRPSGFEIARKGRYVRVQLAGTGSLNLSEVQVFAPVSPLRINLAGGREATQSSTNGLAASAAVNGSSTGYTWSQTASEPGAWWQADLGSVQWISAVDVDNTAPGLGSRLADYYLFISDAPFTSTLLADTLTQAGVSAYYRGPWKSAQSYAVNRTGRFVRLQLTGTDAISPTEVKVFSQLLTLPPLAKGPPVE